MLKLKCMMMCEDREKPARSLAKLPCFLIIVILLSMASEESTAGVTEDICQSVQGKPEISQSQARRKLRNFMSTVGGEVTNSGISFIADGQRKYLNFRNLPETLYLITNFNEGNAYYWVSTRSAHDFPIGALFYWINNKNSAAHCGYIINVMKYYATGAGSADETASFMAFKEKGKAWRALPVKPALPAEANRYRVLAEDAFKNKDFDKAIDYYDKALEAYPLWPQGQFNAALICGETGDYAEAVGHMKRYLELAPDAKDAKAAREKIFIWEEKIDK